LNFAPAVDYGSGGNFPDSVTVTDLNGDGKGDLVVANVYSNTVEVLLGNGDGTFQAAVAYDVPTPSSVVAADVNGDGKPDLVAASQCFAYSCAQGGVYVLLGNGDGTFQPAVGYSSGGYEAASAVVADVNGDGKPDLLVGNSCSSSSSCNNTPDAGTVGVLLGNGDGTFGTAQTYGSGAGDLDGYGETVAVADVNGDGKPDLVLAAQNGTGVLLGNGDGTFQAAVPYGSGGSFVTVADVNGDGSLDLLVGNQRCSEPGCVGVLLGNGDGTFQAEVNYASSGVYVDSVAVADVNGDGKPDLLVAYSCADNSCTGGSVGILLGNGDGTFQSPLSYNSGGTYAQSVAVADVNGDGRPDLVVANDTCSNGIDCVGVLINTSLTATTTALTSSQNPSNFGQAVSFTATVTAQPGFAKGTPTETVSFYDGTTSLGNSNLNSSAMAILTTSTLAPGTHSITATYNGDTNFGSSTSPALSQVVQGPSVRLSPKSINFGNQTVGMGGNQGILVNLTNTGNIALTISSIGITGADSADFFETNICPSSIPAGGVCMLTVGFAPTTTGTRTAALSFTDNAPGSPQTVSLTGVGVLPAVTFSPASLTFPTQIVFTSSKAQTVTLTNTGVGTLSITNITATGAFTQTNNCGSTVNSGSSCTLNVTFEPTKSGSSTGSLSITDNAPLSPQTVSLKGTGTDIQFTPASFNFGNQPVGTKSLPKKFTLTNKGGVAVSIAKISLIGANAPDFAETNTCGTSVAAGASCFITVTFTPSADGKRTADISVSDNGGGSPQTVALSGTGT
jgi:hypothetical protein